MGPAIPAERTPSLELVRIAEAAAISAAHWLGHGDTTRADSAADRAKAMRDPLPLIEAAAARAVVAHTGRTG